MSKTLLIEKKDRKGSLTFCEFCTGGMSRGSRSATHRMLLLGYPFGRCCSKCAADFEKIWHDALMERQID